LAQERRVSRTQILIKEDPSFWWQSLPLKEGLRPTPVGRVELEYSSAIRPRETPLFPRREEVNQIFLAAVKKNFMYL